jgi:hypothetical protein
LRFYCNLSLTLHPIGDRGAKTKLQRDAQSVATGEWVLKIFSEGGIATLVDGRLMLIVV